MLFLVSLSGCDYTSSFLHLKKVKFLNAWLRNSVFFRTFLLYTHSPTLPVAEENLKVTESFVVPLYVTESDISSFVDISNYQIFKYSVNSEI